MDFNVKNTGESIKMAIVFSNVRTNRIIIRVIRKDTKEAVLADLNIQVLVDYDWVIYVILFNIERIIGTNVGFEVEIRQVNSTIHVLVRNLISLGNGGVGLCLDKKVNSFERNI